MSKVLRDAYGVSDALRDKVQASMQKLGYRPHAAARGMRGQTYTLGFLIPDLHNPFFADIMAGVNTALERTQYQTLLGVSDSARTMERALVDNMIDRRMDFSTSTALAFMATSMAPAKPPNRNIEAAPSQALPASDTKSSVGTRQMASTFDTSIEP